MAPTSKSTPSLTFYSLVTGGLSLRKAKAVIDAYLRIPARQVVLYYVLAVALTAALVYSLNYPVLAITLGVAGALAMADLTVRFSSFVATVAVILTISGFTAPIALVFPASVSPAYAMSLPDAVATYFATLVLTGLLAHRTSKGRPWVTTLIAGLGIALVGTSLATLIPGFGFAWAWLVMGVVLWYRANGKAFLGRHARRLWRTLRPASVTKVDTGTPEASRTRAERAAALARRKRARNATAAVLADLPAGYFLYTDIPAVGGSTREVQHMVTGPTGVWVIESEKVTGTVHSDPDRGLFHKNVPVPLLLDNAARRGLAMARHLRRTSPLPTRVHTLVVIHDAILPVDVAGVSVRSDDQERFVIVTAPEALIETITAPKPTMKPKRLARIDDLIAPTCLADEPGKGR